MRLALGKQKVVFAEVDADLYDELSQWTWTLGGNGYAYRLDRSAPIARKLYLHHVLLPRTNELVVDHINQNKLDNRRSNLRLVTRLENNRNVRRRRTNTSGATGVSWVERLGKWRAYITVDGRQKHLGLFDDSQSAAIAREAAEISTGRIAA